MSLDPLPAGLVSAWERLLSQSEKLTLDPSPGVCEAVYADPILFPLQRQAEMAAMLRLAASRSPKVVGELGADKGGSVLHWCLLPSVERVIACEIRGTPYARAFEASFPRIKFHWMPCPSRDVRALDALSGWLNWNGPNPIDVLFLDGEKAAFEADFDAYLPLMNPAGLVLTHDVTDEPTGAAFRRIAARGKYACREIIDRTDSDRAVRRQEQGIPAATAHEGWHRHWCGRSCGVGVIELGGKRHG